MIEVCRVCAQHQLERRCGREDRSRCRCGYSVFRILSTRSVYAALLPGLFASNLPDVTNLLWESNVYIVKFALSNEDCRPRQCVTVI